MNYYLQAESEEALFAALESAGVTQRHYDMDDFSNVRPADLDPDEAWTPTGKYDSLPVAGVDLDVIGTIWKPTGNALMTEEGEVFEHAPIDGWHVNVRHHNAEAPELEAYRVFPATPQRMWF